MQRWLAKILGFVAGAGVVIALEAMVVVAFSSGGYRLIPRGLGWFALPLLAGIVGAGYAEYFLPKFLTGISDRSYGSPGWRLYFISVIIWAAAVFCWGFVFDGMGRHWYSSEWEFFWKLLIVPPVFLAAAYWLFVRFGPEKPQ